MKMTTKVPAGDSEYEVTLIIEKLGDAEPYGPNGVFAYSGWTENDVADDDHAVRAEWIRIISATAPYWQPTHDDDVTIGEAAYASMHDDLPVDASLAYFADGRTELNFTFEDYVPFDVTITDEEA